LANSRRPTARDLRATFIGSPPRVVTGSRGASPVSCPVGAAFRTLEGAGLRTRPAPPAIVSPCAGRATGLDMRRRMMRILAMLATAAGAATLATDRATAPAPMSQPAWETESASATQGPTPACAVRTGELDFGSGHVPADARQPPSSAGAPLPSDAPLWPTSPSTLLPNAWEEPNAMLLPAYANPAENETTVAGPGQPPHADPRRLVVPGLGSVILVLVGVALATRRGGPLLERAARVPVNPSCTATKKNREEPEPGAANPKLSAERD